MKIFSQNFLMFSKKLQSLSFEVKGENSRVDYEKRVRIQERVVNRGMGFEKISSKQNASP